MLQQIPGIGTTFTSGYGEMEIIKHFDSLKGYLTMFQPEELDRIQSFSTGFKFLGLDLLATPSTSPFSSMLWLIPVLCLVTSLGANFAMQKLDARCPAAGRMYESHDVWLPLLHCLVGVDDACRRRILLHAGRLS